jgi:signal transduction histidine kinase/ActR/RegA family two-component response regulator
MINQTYAKLAACALIALGVGVLIGWEFDIMALKTVIPGLNSMKVNTAIGFVLFGFVLLSLSRLKPSFPVQAGGNVAAFTVALIGFFSAVESIYNVNLGIDEFFYTDYASRATTVIPGQMSIITAGLFLLCGVTAFVSRASSTIGQRAFVVGTTIGLIVSLVLLLVYVYGAPVFFLKIRASSVAMHTVVGFIILFAGLAATRPDLGLVARLNAPTAGGQFVRRLTVAIVLGVPTLGWLRLQGELLGWYDGRVGLALFASANVVLMMAVTWAGGYKADQADSKRLQDKLSQQQALANFSTSALSARSMTELFKLAIDCMVSAMKAKVGSVLEADEVNGTMRGVSAVGPLNVTPFVRNISEYPETSVLIYALKHKKLFWFNNIATEKRFTFFEGEKAGFRSGAILPVPESDGTTRFLSIFFGEPHEFTADELEFLQSLANTFSVAYERRRMADVLQVRMSQRNALANLSSQALSFSTNAELTRAALSTAFSNMGADFGSFAEFNEEDDVVHLLSMAPGGEVQNLVRRFSDYPPTSVLFFAMDNEEAFWFSDIDKEQRFTFNDARFKPFKSGIVAPIAGTDGRKRRLSLFFEKPHMFTANEIELMTSIARITANAHDRLRSSIELKAQNEALEKADRAKSEFLAMMSHELRTPMAGLLGLADLMMLTTLNDEQAQLVQRMVRSGKALVDILNDILDFSKLDAEKMTLENVPFKLSDLLSDLRELFAPVASEKGLNLSFLLPLQYQDAVIGDVKRMRQVITNLLNNAMKFTKAGTVSVSIVQTVNEDRSLRTNISVADTGIGIEPEKLRLLFKPFVQADTSTSRQYGGTGLGLAICERLVTLMRGEITVSSRVGQGSTFSFVVPLQIDLNASGSTKLVPRAPRTQSDDASKLKAPSVPRRILLAEDNDTNRMLITAMLEKHGHTVEAVENGKMALDAARDKSYDIILMDMQMPVMDGPTAMRSIREAERDGLKRIPIIALTADVIAENGKNYLAAGADAIVAKPVNWPVLYAEIDKQLHASA